MSLCLFCQIIDKKIPADIVYEDEFLIAFKDIRPVAPMHLLILPKQHIASLAECTEEHADILGKMMVLAPKLAEEHGCQITLDENGVFKGGYNTRINIGPKGGQEIYHLHMHLYGEPQQI